MNAGVMNHLMIVTAKAMNTVSIFLEDTSVNAKKDTNASWKQNHALRKVRALILTTIKSEIIFLGKTLTTTNEFLLQKSPLHFTSASMSELPH
jgi:hypothetical protein